MRVSALENLAENEKAALAEYLIRLGQHHTDQILHVILFGSKARGDFGPGSDLDLLIVVLDDDWRLHKKVSRLAFEPMVEHDTLLSTHTIGRTLYTKMQRRHTPFYGALQEEGIELWTRQPEPISAIISS